MPSEQCPRCGNYHAPCAAAAEAELVTARRERDEAQAERDAAIELAKRRDDFLFEIGEVIRHYQDTLFELAERETPASPKDAPYDESIADFRKRYAEYERQRGVTP